MNLEQAEELHKEIQNLLKGYMSYVKVVPDSGDGYRVVILQHDTKLPKLPSSVSIVQGVPTSKPTPDVNIPSMPGFFSKDLNKPMSPINRQTDPLSKNTNLGPQGEAYDRPYMWRGIQDTVKKWANMKPEIQQKLSAVATQLQKLATERDHKIDKALEQVQASILHHGYKPSHPLMRNLVKLQKSYDVEVAQTLVNLLIKLKFVESDPTLVQAKLALELIKKHQPGLIPSEKDLEKARLAHQTSDYLEDLEKICSKLATSLNRLNLHEESQQMKVMAASAKDICAAVKKLND